MKIKASCLFFLILSSLNLSPVFAKGFAIPQTTGWKQSSAATITAVGTAVCYTTYVSGSATTFSYTAAHAGDALVVMTQNLAGGTNTFTITDNGASGGSAYSTLLAAGTGPNVAFYGTLSLAASVTSVTITNSISGYTLGYCVSEYSGPLHFGNTTGNISFSASPYSINTTTQDSNNYAVASCVSGSSPVLTPTATAGTVRAYYARAYGNTWIVDNTGASPGTVTNSGTLSTSTSGKCSAVELRTH